MPYRLNATHHPVVQKLHAIYIKKTARRFIYDKRAKRVKKMFSIGKLNEPNMFIQMKMTCLSLKPCFAQKEHI